MFKNISELELYLENCAYHESDSSGDTLRYVCTLDNSKIKEFIADGKPIFELVEGEVGFNFDDTEIPF